MAQVAGFEEVVLIDTPGITGVKKKNFFALFELQPNVRWGIPDGLNKFPLGESQAPWGRAESGEPLGPPSVARWPKGPLTVTVAHEGPHG